jgi:hypothetical protein
VLRLDEVVEAGRRHYPDAGGDPGAAASDPDGAREFSCPECEMISPPAPFHVTPRGFAGPNLLAMILFEKFGQHQPLNRQSERYWHEGIDLSVSTLADQVGACTAVLQPLHALIERHVLSAERLHGERHDGADPGQGPHCQRAYLGLCP